MSNGGATTTMINSCSIWVTGKCGLGCVYCYLNKQLQVDMTEEVLEATVNWMRFNRVSMVDFFGGEPFEYPYGIKYIVAKSDVKRFGVTTNGILLNESLYDWIKMFGFSINLSLDGTKKTQDKYRNNSYDAIIKNLDKWLNLPVNVTMTLSEPSNLYENVSHVKELGFKDSFINGLKPYGFGYEGDLNSLESQYKKVITELHNPPNFSVGDYLKLAKASNDWAKSDSRGCGINRRGYAVGPRGYIYPCHAAVDMGEDYIIGSVFNGIDPVRERKIRKTVGVVPEKCKSCDMGCLPCPVSCYAVHGELGVDPEDWFCKALKIRVKVVQDLMPRAVAVAGKAF